MFEIKNKNESRSKTTNANGETESLHVSKQEEHQE
jgi:hypothetical protein